MSESDNFKEQRGHLSSMLAKEIPPTLPKPRKPLQPEFESMDDIKPMARGIPTILKRPLPKTE
ncbi:hypothetical protein MFLAVUS_004077 [Mucor flavus]|uniref:Uncharacterized protein n=1 Tax=Mucor flavus TaxID=439312 RepID=A0ABP9YUV3_9FUNG